MEERDLGFFRHPTSRAPSILGQARTAGKRVHAMPSNTKRCVLPQPCASCGVLWLALRRHCSTVRGAPVGPSHLSAVCPARSSELDPLPPNGECGDGTRMCESTLRRHGSTACGAPVGSSRPIAECSVGELALRRHGSTVCGTPVGLSALTVAGSVDALTLRRHGSTVGGAPVESAHQAVASGRSWDKPVDCAPSARSGRSWDKPVDCAPSARSGRSWDKPVSS